MLWSGFLVVFLLLDLSLLHELVPFNLIEKGLATGRMTTFHATTLGGLAMP